MHRESWPWNPEWHRRRRRVQSWGDDRLSFARSRRYGDREAGRPCAQARELLAEGAIRSATEKSATDCQATDQETVLAARWPGHRSVRLRCSQASAMERSNPSDD